MTDRLTRAHAEWRTSLTEAARTLTNPYGLGDTAGRLLTGGTWHTGTFYRVVSVESDVWISDTGMVIPAHAVNAWELTGTARIQWLEQIKAAPSADCGNSQQPAVELDWDNRDEDGEPAEKPAVIGEMVWCGECESSVRAVAGDSDVPVYAAHDLRGRLLEPAQPV